MEKLINRTPQANADALRHMFNQPLTFDGANVDEIKQAIFNGDGATCALLGLDYYWQDGNIQVPNVPPDDESLWAHFIVLIGWDDKIKKIEAVNSWGAFWGYNGFMYIPYDYFAKGYSMSEYTLVEMPAVA